MEKLYELHESTDFDLVVVDTPPTRNALDFLEAPRRLTRFLDHRLYRVLMAPDPGRRPGGERGRPGLPAHRVEGRRRRRGRATPSPSSRPSTAWRQGFRDRAARRARPAVATTSPPSCWWPRRAATSSTRRTYFAAKLAEADIPVRALIVNRMHPRFSDASPGCAAPSGPRPSPAPTSAASTPTSPTSPRSPPTRRTHLAGPGRAGGAGAGGAGAVPAHRRARPRRPAPRSAATSSRAERPWRVRSSADGRSAWVEQARSTAASTVSVTGTMRSKPVVWSRRVRVGRLQATDTSPSASRARRMPPMSAPRPAESMNGTSDRSMSSRGLLASSASDSRNWPTVYASSSPIGRHSV